MTLLPPVAFCNQSPERAVSAPHALKLAYRAAQRYGLTVDLLQYGGAVRTHHCILKEASNIKVSSGSGKGLGAQSQASAVFEALEHYFSGPTQLTPRHPRVRIEEISTQCRLSEERPFMLMKGMGDESIPCRRYLEISGGTTPLFYPIFLSTPGYANRPFADDTFDYTKLSKYSTNSGTAIGVSRSEAILHALHEVIERDAVSTFLIQSYIDPRPAPVRFLPREIMPVPLKELIADIELQTGGAVTIVEITNDISVPVYLASLPRQGRAIRPVGYGASLSRSYAIERACLEALQAFHLHNDEMEAEDEYVLSVYASLPRLRACIERNWNFPCIRRIVDSTEAGLTGPVGSLEGQVSATLTFLARKGYRAYASEIWSSEDGLSCVHVVIPGLEKFNIITSGNPVLPSARGMAFLN